MGLFAHGAEKGDDKRQYIGAAAGDKGQALEADHVFADVGIQSGAAHIGRPGTVEPDEVDQVLLAGDLRLQIGKIVAGKAADKIVAGAAGNDPQSGVGAAGQPLQDLVHGAVAAAAVKAQTLPPGCGTAFPDKAGGIAHTGGQVNLHLLLPSGKQRVNAGNKGDGDIGFAGGGVDDKDVFHRAEAP